MLRVEVTQQGHPPRTYAFDKRRIHVGRGSDCDLVLKAPGISTVHAQIVQAQGHCVVIDQNSTNGTYLHGAPIHGPTQVKPDESLYICSYCLHIEAVESSPAQPESKQAPRELEPLQEPPFLSPRRDQEKEQVSDTEPAARTSGSITSHTATIAPKDELDPSRKHASQKISVQAAPSSGNHAKIEQRNWAIPGAPTHLDHDPQVLAKVFASLAQTFVERQELPPGDKAARAQFYALAQGQLSVNLAAQSTHMERGAEDIVRALCAIGPLTELLSSGFLAKSGHELLAAPFVPLRTRNLKTPHHWQIHDRGFVHPWALRFTAARLLGCELQSLQHSRTARLSNGVTLRLIADEALDCGPLLVLRTPPEPGQSWPHYLNSHPLEPRALELLQSAVASRISLLVCDSATGAMSVWNGLQDLALEHGTLTHIHWEDDASLVNTAMNFGARQCPSAQQALCRQALDLDLCQVLAVDAPCAPALETLGTHARGAGRTLWLRIRNQAPEQAIQDLAKAGFSGRHLGPAGVGLVLHTRAAPQDPSCITLQSIFELHHEVGQPPQLSPLFERRERELEYVGETPRIYAALAQGKHPIAPPV